jgi:predicted nucleic acid-binding protein
MTRVVLDSNILIGVLNGTIDWSIPTSFEQQFISTISIMELFAFSGISHHEEETIKHLMETMITVPVSFSIAEQAGRLSRTRRVGKADLLIAATALELGLPLMTRNVKDFKKIPGLKFV